MNIVNRNGERVFPCSVPLWIDMAGVLPWGRHVVRTRHLVKLFACLYIALWESEFSHGFEEHSVVRASKGSIEVGVGCVNMFFSELGVFMQHDVC